MSSSSSSNKFILKSSDGETFEIDEAAAAVSETIKHLIEADCAGNVIPLPNVTGSILAKVVEYCKKHAKIDGKDSEAKLSITEIDDKDSESKDCNSISQLEINEIGDKDSETKYCHFLTEQSIDDISDQDSEAKDCHSLAKLSIDEIEISLQRWDAEFVKVDQKTLFDLIMAANYLHIKSLTDLTCNTVADMIRGKCPEEMREILNIKNDFTEEEEEKIRKENEWAFLE